LPHKRKGIYTGFDLAMIDEGKLEEVFRRYPRVEAVYLFGSAAEGRARAASDLDLAVLPTPGSDRARRCPHE